MQYEQLIDELKKGPGLGRAKAAADLGKLCDIRAMHPFVDALNDSHMTVRSNAAYALEEIGAKDAAPFLIELLKDPSDRPRKSGKGTGHAADT